MKKTRVIIYGCGVMGKKATEALLAKKSLEIVGAVDIAAGLVGKDLGQILDRPKKLGIPIQRNAKEVFSKAKAQAVVLTTTSHLKKVFPQIEECVKARLNVISTCEELSYPWKRSPGLAARIDKLARSYGVTVVGTGINPGYLMDTLPLVLTGPCLKVKAVKVKRMMNSARRRIPFQAKVGTNLTKSGFRKKIDSGTITGHVGLLESINMIADGLGWKLDSTKEFPPQPVIAKKNVKTGLGVVPKGKVIGLVSKAHAHMGGKEVITLDFYAYAGVKKEYDEIFIKGTPNIHEKILGGVHGDIGTVAVTVNVIPRAVEAEPGLKLMKDLPPAVATL
jgi:4-hydroxy-tetrahydrodipicolinate reductase